MGLLGQVSFFEKIRFTFQVFKVAVLKCVKFPEYSLHFDSNVVKMVQI